MSLPKQSPIVVMPRAYLMPRNPNECIRIAHKSNLNPARELPGNAAGNEGVAFVAVALLTFCGVVIPLDLLVHELSPEKACSKENNLKKYNQLSLCRRRRSRWLACALTRVRVMHVAGLRWFSFARRPVKICS